jgi:hypothetical protein
MGACGDKDRGTDNVDHHSKPTNKELHGKIEDKHDKIHHDKDHHDDIHKELDDLDKHGHFDTMPSSHVSHVEDSHHVTKTTTYTVSSGHSPKKETTITYESGHSPKKEKHTAYADMRSTVDHHKEPSHHDSSKPYSYSHETSDGKHRAYGNFESKVETTYHYENKDGKHTAYGDFKSTVDRE